MLGHKVAAVTLAAGVGRFGQGRAAQYLQDGTHTVADTLVVVPGFKGRGDDLVDNHRGLGIGEAILKAIADLDAQLAVVAGHDQQGAVIFVLLPDTPGTAQLVAVVFDGHALQVRHGDHHHLLAGGLFVSLQALRQLLAGGGREHLPLVHYPPAERGKGQRLGRGYK